MNPEWPLDGPGRERGCSWDRRLQHWKVSGRCEEFSSTLPSLRDWPLGLWVFRSVLTQTRRVAVLASGVSIRVVVFLRVLCMQRTC